MIETDRLERDSHDRDILSRGIAMIERACKEILVMIKRDWKERERTMAETEWIDIVNNHDRDRQNKMHCILSDFSYYE